MIARDRGAAPATPVRIAIAIAALIAAVLLGRLVFVHKLSQEFFREPDFRAAYAANRHDGMQAAYLAAALQRIAGGRVAEPLARLALVQTPLAAPAIGVVAAADAQRDPVRAARLLAAATAMGWRDPIVQIWAAQLALRQGNAADAAGHADAAARIEGVGPQVRALLDTLAAAPETRAALVARLQLRPVWRSDYLAGLDRPYGNIAARQAVLIALAHTPAPPSAIETGGVVMLTGMTATYDRAYAVWRAVAHPTVPHFVFDPDFAHVSADPSNTVPFVWTVRSAAGLSGEADRIDGADALHATADGSAVGPIAVQVIAIPPGHHTLQVKARLGSAAAASAFRWTLSCWDGHSPPWPIPPLIGPATGAAHYDFVVAPNCPTQAIALEAQQADAAGPAEAWFNAVRID